jgi:hypothetical protein
MEEGLEVAPRRSSDVANPSLRARNLGVLLTPAARTKAIHPFSWAGSLSPYERHPELSEQYTIERDRLPTMQRTLSAVMCVQCPWRLLDVVQRRNRHLASPVPRFITYGALPSSREHTGRPSPLGQLRTNTGSECLPHRGRYYSSANSGARWGHLPPAGYCLKLGGLSNHGLPIVLVVIKNPTEEWTGFILVTQCTHLRRNGSGHLRV